MFIVCPTFCMPWSVGRPSYERYPHHHHHHHRLCMHMPTPVMSGRCHFGFSWSTLLSGCSPRFVPLSWHNNSLTIDRIECNAVHAIINHCRLCQSIFRPVPRRFTGRMIDTFISLPTWSVHVRLRCCPAFALLLVSFCAIHPLVFG